MTVDLRSDTVTRPSPEMYEAMSSAVLGDDVLGDDPTVEELERVAAETVGKEASLFVPSGTMGNQIALACWVERGDAFLIEEEAHIAYYEVGAPAILAGAMAWTLPSEAGVMDPDVIESRILTRNLHTPGTTLLCLEDTHNRAGGTVIPLGHLTSYREIADRHGLRIHMDGARVFNAAVAQRVDVREIAQHTDSLNFCLSKGLRAPVGSVLTGPQDFIERARRWRKRLGGGMRQAGILAACGLVSLRQMVDRLAEDHLRARRVAEAIQGFPGVCVDMDRVQTNIVRVDTVEPADAFVAKLAASGLACFPVAPNRLRLVFHADVDDEGADLAIQAFRTATGV